VLSNRTISFCLFTLMLVGCAGNPIKEEVGECVIPRVIILINAIS
jgi:hypothetical protein